MDKPPGKLDVKAIANRFNQQHINIQKPNEIPEFRSKPRLPDKEKPMFINPRSIKPPSETQNPVNEETYDDIEASPPETKPDPPPKPKPAKKKPPRGSNFKNELESRLMSGGPISPKKPNINAPPTSVKPNRNPQPTNGKSQIDEIIPPELPPRNPDREIEQQHSKPITLNQSKVKNSRINQPLPPIPNESIQKRQLPSIPKEDSTEDRHKERSLSPVRKRPDKPKAVRYNGQKLPLNVEIDGRMHTLTPLGHPTGERVPERPPRNKNVVAIVPNPEYIQSEADGDKIPDVSEEEEAEFEMQQRLIIEHGKSSAFEGKSTSQLPNVIQDDLYDDTEIRLGDPLYDRIVEP